MNEQPPSLPRTNDSLSVTSLVLGILSLVPCSIIAGIPAIITGHIAVNRTTTRPAEYGGKGMAMAGLVMGYLSIALALLLIPISASLLLPALAKGKANAQRVQCMNNLRQIVLAARIYAEDHTNKWPADFASMGPGLVSPTILICPLDKKTRTAAADWSTFTPANASYEFLTPGIDESEVSASVSAFRCPIHNNIARTDGSVTSSRRIDSDR